MRRLALLLAALFLALLAPGCGGSGDDDQAAEPAAPGDPALTDLTSVDQFKERFNADQGVPRLVVLVAPT
jgi:hypothetical protein